MRARSDCACQTSRNLGMSSLILPARFRGPQRTPGPDIQVFVPVTAGFPDGGSSDEDLVELRTLQRDGVLFFCAYVNSGLRRHGRREFDEVYNTRHLHSALAYLSPQQFEDRSPGRGSNPQPDSCPAPAVHAKARRIDSRAPLTAQLLFKRLPKLSHRPCIGHLIKRPRDHRCVSRQNANP
jgi:hypothetical protein